MPQVAFISAYEIETDDVHDQSQNSNPVTYNSLKNWQYCSP